MLWVDQRTSPPTKYLINLIDTPGHVDFSYEVERSLASCQGALLLVDSTQSVQAQTISNYRKARALGLGFIPVITKIDLPNSLPEEAALAMESTFNIDPDTVIMTSAKANIGIEAVIEAVIDRLPSPHVMLNSQSIASNASSFRARIVDSWFDEHRGVVCLIQVIHGQISEGQRITTFASMQQTGNGDTKTDFSVQEIGVLTPTPTRTHKLRTGQVGYLISGMRSTRQAKIGDTMYIPNLSGAMHGFDDKDQRVVPLDGYVDVKPMLFASVFPVDATDLESLYAAVDRLLLNDSSITITKETSPALGSGLRCGFLGYLHMEVFNQRLQDEYGVSVVITTPSVPYRIEYESGFVELISNITNFPDASKMIRLNESGTGRCGKFSVFEPLVHVTIISPIEFYGALTDIIKLRRGERLQVVYLDDAKTVSITADVPWQEVVVEMHDQIKNASSGYASFNYEEGPFEMANLVKVDICVNNEICDPLSFISHASSAADSGRNMVTKLRQVIDRQQFEIIIQAKMGSKVLAKDRIAPYRKDVLSRNGKVMGGGDVTRKMKLLEKQKEGKKRAKMIGRVEISQEAFWSVLQR